MGSPWILLERRVRFAVPSRETSDEDRSQEDEAGSNHCPGNRPSVILRPTRRRTSPEEITESMVAKLHAMKPDPQVLEPPEISYLSMVNEMGVDLSQGYISSTHKALVALYAGRYRPASGTPKSRCYLVYDAFDSSLCAIPQLPDRHTFRALGRRAATMSLSRGSYLLAELVQAKSGFPDAELFLWQSPSRNQQAQWLRTKVHLPAHVFSRYFNFKIDMVFVHTESRVCWVDLLKGILVCNLIESPEPQFTFVPLPVGCYIEVDSRGLPRSGDFRTMGSVCGAIKFVTVDGFNEGCPGEEITLKTWTLSHDLKDWEPGKSLRAGDLWKRKSFRESGLPPLVPSSPVLSSHEPDVVYVVLNDIDRVDVVNAFGEVYGANIVRKIHCASPRHSATGGP